MKPELINQTAFKQYIKKCISMEVEGIENELKKLRRNSEKQQDEISILKFKVKNLK